MCINPTHVSYASQQLLDTDVLVCTVIGFPLGATTTDVKVFETENAIKNGASEIDMVINIGALKDQRYDEVQKILRVLSHAANGKTVKVIIETVLLTDEEKVKACELAEKQALLLLKHLQDLLVGSYTRRRQINERYCRQPLRSKSIWRSEKSRRLRKMIEAGATRIGASAGVQIIEGLDSNSDY